MTLEDKKAAFKTLERAHSVQDDSYDEETPEQALLNMNLPLDPACPLPHVQPHNDTRKENDHVICSASELSFGAECNVRAPAAPSKVRSPASTADGVVTLRTTKRRDEVIVIDDDESSVSEGRSQPTNPVVPQHIPSSFIGTPRPLTGQKRKRRSSIPKAPESKRMLNRCKIFFFPNNDNDKARRIRITRAIEHGATWIEHWHPSVTHVVVDRNNSYQLLLQHLEVTALEKNIVLVNDQYTIDCIYFSILVNHNQSQYLVRDAPETAEGMNITKGASSGPRSPDVQPYGDLEAVLPGTTPAASEQSDGHIRSRIKALDDSDHEDDESMPETLSRSMSGSDYQAGAIEGPNSLADLDQAISAAKQTAHLPLEEEEEEHHSSRPGYSHAEQADVPQWQRSFTCMRRTSSDSISITGPNSNTINLLKQLGEYYASVHDEWRSRAYRIAVSKLKEHPCEVTTAEQAKSIPGIGGRLADKIEEISRTSRLQRLENALLEPTDQALKIFLGIYGVGWQQAQAWARQGFRTLDDLKKSDVQLTENQRIGVDHYDDFQKRIPREEVTKLATVVIQALRNIDKNFKVIIGGSYRRGAASSGDIDLILTHPTHPTARIRAEVLTKLIPHLFQQRFLTAALAATSQEDGTKWHGACVLPASHSTQSKHQTASYRPWRRIDFLLVPNDELGAALLYFTGNDIFNRSMRLLARKKGMRLNQRGLYKNVARSRSGQRLNEGTRVAGWDEKGVFDALGVPWRQCTERDC